MDVLPDRLAWFIGGPIIGLLTVALYAVANKHLDVRDPWEYAEGRIPGALSLPQADLARRLGEVPKDRDVLVVCATGNRSLRSAGFLKAVDYSRVTNLAGGTNGWIEAGNPVETEH